MKFICISQGWDGCAVSYMLQHEGADITLGQIQDKSELRNGDDHEEPKEKASRLKQFDGMLKKVPAKELIKALIKVKNKDDYFIFVDQNSLWYYAEILVKAGFTKGLFPTKKDYEFEKSREMSMEFVSANYEGIDIIPFEEFSTVDDAIDFLEESDIVYVIQSKGDHVSTYVPQNDDAEVAKKESIGQLEKYRKEYEKGGLILKTKLIEPVEITPQAVFFDGKLVYTDLDIETKNIGDGQNNGNQVGCGNSLLIATDEKDSINKIAFPKAVYDMAKEHTGLFVWDISLYLLDGKMYFGEFCPNRFGYDSVMAECDMAGGVEKFFCAIMCGKKPLKAKFGTSLRLFNLSLKEGQTINFEGVEEHTWLYEAYKKGEDGDDILSLGDCWDLGVVSSSADTIEEAVDKLYEYKEKFSFKEVYARSKSDFLADYPTSMIHRFNAINHKYIEAPGLKSYDTVREELKAELNKEYENTYASIKSEYDMKYSKVKNLIKDIIYGEDTEQQEE